MKNNNKHQKNTAFFYFHLERKKMPRFWAVFGHSVLFLKKINMLFSYIQL